MASGEELYTLNGTLLKELKPDVILTQNICSVCSIDAQSVARTVGSISPAPLVVELNPGNLQDVLADIIKVGYKSHPIRHLPQMSDPG
jgi:iron complex transport system substrate-binding protein